MKKSEFYKILLSVTMLLSIANFVFAEDALYIDEDGHVGIGTSNPQAKLHIDGGIKYVRGSFGDTPLVQENNWIRDAWLTSQGATNLHWDDAIKKWKRYVGEAPYYGWNDFGGILFYGNKINFIKGEYGSVGEWADAEFRDQFVKMTIMGSGNVGVGTESPVSKLNVQGGTDVELSGSERAGYIVLGDLSGENIGIDNNEIMARNNGSQSPLYLQMQGGNTILNLNGGSVGIGRGPSYKLDVNGNARISSNMLVEGNIKYKASSHSVEMTNAPGYLQYNIDGNLYGVSIWSSSRRFKENIKPLDISSNKIFSLEPVSFNWIEERGGKDDFGLIAEDVAKIIPELALYDEEGKPFSVRYELVSVLLLKEVKIQKAKNEDLMERLSDLEKQNIKMKSRLDEIEKMLSSSKNNK